MGVVANCLKRPDIVGARSMQPPMPSPIWFMVDKILVVMPALTAFWVSVP